MSPVPSEPVALSCTACNRKACTNRSPPSPSPTPPPVQPVTFEDVSTAMYRIRDGIVRTPCLRSHFLSELCQADIYLKQEFTQFTGSFKERGARNALMKLTAEEKRRGVIAASAGNHALALAWHGRQMGIPVTVCMPVLAPMTKVSKCKVFGANVVQHGMHIIEAKDHAQSAPEFEGMKYINGYDHPDIIAGAGTMGMEILEQVPNVEVVVVPVGGAGLIAGIALAVKTLRPDVKVIGVEPEFCPSYTAALEAITTPTLADGLAVPMVGHNAFAVAKNLVDSVHLVTERCVALAVLRLVEMEKYVVEGGGCAGLAALLPGGSLDIASLKGKKIVVPLCGGNIDVPVLGRVIDRGLAADSRLVRFITPVSDRPGGIATLARIISDSGGSIRDIYHERAWLHTHMDQVQIKCVVEVTGKDHQQLLHDNLESAGFSLIWGKASSNSVDAW
ncbi:tryptophan synthase beta subunit-like PLP-dependent enzyme [Tribonema minus]|uniref:Tryptophan synthase beta subunit-like PLP-dependent enzyme n=1 Tax=Tribonema minus TaxID=303371 RepID=A0A835YZY4_9STRA|nr:tryptophan synthase beta subunit-like PLP-dependent enzyme [Tribonema minus]